MITPTGATFAEVSSAIRQRKPQHLRITIDDRVLTDANIDIDGIGYHEVLNGANDLTIGRCVCSSVDLSLMNDTGDLSDLDFTGEFTVELGVEVGSTTVYGPLGVFIGQKPSKVLSNIISFTGNDRMVLFEKDAGPFLDSLNYSQTLGSIFDALCTYVGVTGIRTQANTNVSKVITSSPFDGVGVSCKDVLGWIAEACGCYARMSRTGDCELVWFTDHTSDYTFQRTDYFEMDLAEFSVPVIDSVQIRVTENDVGASYPTTGTPTNVYEIIDSPYLYGDSASAIQTDAQPIYTRLHGFASYKPLTLDCEANWFLQCGDIVGVIDTDGVTVIPFPIFSMDITYSGRATGTCGNTGSETREAVSNTKRSLMRNNARWHDFQLTLDQLRSEITTQLHVYIRATDPQLDPHIVLQVGDFWVKSLGGSTHEFLSDFTNEELEQLTHDELSGATSTYTWNGTQWIETNDTAAVSTLTTLIEQTNEKIDLEVIRATMVEGQKYTVQSGIDITIDGVEISGNKWIKLLTDGVIYATSWQFSKNGLTFNDGTYTFAVRSTGDDFEIEGLGLYSNSNVMIVPENGDFGAFTLLVAGGIEHGVRTEMITLESVNTHNVRIGSSLNSITYLWVKDILENGEITFSPYSGDHGTIKMGRFQGGNTYVLLYADAPYSAIGGQAHWWTEIWGAYIYYQILIQQSSRKLKKAIKALPSAGEKIDALKPVTYQYKADKNGKTHMGLIYEETVEVVPEICVDGPSDEQKGINYVELIPMLIKEIQDLRKRVAELEKKGND